MLTQTPQTNAEEIDSTGLRQVATPASGNSLAMEIVHGANGKGLAKPTSKLGQLTGTLEIGVMEVGLLSLGDCYRMISG
ncbi:hypothetical protein CCR75_000399 [Bremia lactucae]|uniref:Uncharacterized protein n=1 Tax=Bremia lactucae TaxID=4779 RepID=A0A976FJA9_BRELC|nr:hypothetical protein CCR75_000399 [Bremia lactucae]